MQNVKLSFHVRELAILYALFILPGVVQAGRVTAPPPSLIPTLLYYTAFPALILHLRAISSQAGLSPFPVRVSVKGSSIPTAMAAAGVLLAASMLMSPAGFYTDTTPLPLDPLTIPLVVVVAITEELFFRAYTLHALQESGASPRIAMLVSALLFGVSHTAQGVGGVVFATVAGITLGTVWVRRKNLVTVAGAHITYNLIALLISRG